MFGSEICSLSFFGTTGAMNYSRFVKTLGRTFLRVANTTVVLVAVISMVILPKAIGTDYHQISQNGIRMHNPSLDFLRFSNTQQVHPFLTAEYNSPVKAPTRRNGKQEEDHHKPSAVIEMTNDDEKHEHFNPQEVHISSNMESEDVDGSGSTLSPLDQTIQALTTPEQLIPIINDLTFMTLLILHLPAIIPTILIPLAFFVVGCFLIPVVRVNYFINHKDDGEDGRSSAGDNLYHLVSLFIN